MKFFRPGLIVRWLLSDALFRIKTRDRICCLTYDDGPDPESTSLLLDLLDKYQVKAMFFCSGKASSGNPDLISEIKTRGHLIGNHGFDHRDGWKTSSSEYFKDIEASAGITSDRFFRPPYGKMTLKQYRHLRKFYRIILWDVMPYDFDSKFNPEKSLDILKKKLRPGSVVVLHDIPGSSLYITERFLEFAGSAGYSFVLPD